MAPFGYHPVQHTAGIWVHESRKALFSLVVDCFCVQYSSTEDADHFLNALISNYLITVDMAASVYIRIKLEWEYVHTTVTLLMQSYVHKDLHRFQHIMSGGKKYSPHTYSPIHYGRRVKYADPLDAAEYLLDKETNLIQQVCGTLLY